MAKEIIQTRDAQIWLGWPTQDIGDQYVQVGVLYGDQAAWASLNAGQVDELRRQLQRAKRRTYGKPAA